MYQEFKSRLSEIMQNTADEDALAPVIWNIETSIFKKSRPAKSRYYLTPFHVIHLSDNRNR
jgi:hypothetical protein